MSRWDKPGSGSPEDAAAAAAAAAAKIAAQFKGPASSPSAPGPSTSAVVGGPAGAAAPDFLEKIEINDQRNRYMLTKGATQQQILKETGASVTTKGTWYPDKTMATAADPPLYLEITATSQESLNRGIEMVRDFMKQDLPQLIEDRNAKRLEWEAQRPPARDAGWGVKKKWPEEKVVIGLESLRNFNVRAKVVGPGGLFVKYIQQETGARVQIKGQGSGYIDHDTGRESDEPMHVHIASPDESALAEAKRLAEDLLEVVRVEYAKAQAALGYFPQQQQQYGHGAYPPQQQQQQQWQGGYAQPGAPLPPPGGEMPPPPPTDDAPPPPPGSGAVPPPGYASAPTNGYGAQQQPYQQQQSTYRQPSFTPASSTTTGAASSSTAAAAAPNGASQSGASAEQDALDKYWKDYVAWEKSFVDYHKRLPTADEGKQEVPPQYRA